MGFFFLMWEMFEAWKSYGQRKTLNLGIIEIILILAV